MNRSLKLGLDFLFGLIIPIIILSRFSDQLGNITAYVVSALIPVAWVAIDLLFITKRFNFITTFLGLNAVVRGILAFWFVDGVAYAFKDSVASLLWVVIFGASLVFGRPLIGAFINQAFDPRTPKQESSLKSLFDEFPVRRAMWMGTLAITVVSMITTVANFFLNLWIVVAEFGTEAFNFQVARANAIARFAIAVPEALVLVAVMGLVLKIVYDRLPKTEEDTDFWDLMEMREEPEAGKSGVEATESETTEAGKGEAGKGEAGKGEAGKGEAETTESGTAESGTAEDGEDGKDE